MTRRGYTGGIPVGAHYQVVKERRRNWWYWVKDGRRSRQHWFERPLPFTGATAVCGVHVPQGVDEMDCAAKPDDACETCARIYTETVESDPIGTGVEALGRLLDQAAGRHQRHYTLSHRVRARGLDDS